MPVRGVPSRIKMLARCPGAYLVPHDGIPTRSALSRLFLRSWTKAAGAAFLSCLSVNLCGKAERLINRVTGEMALRFDFGAEGGGFGRTILIFLYFLDRLGGGHYPLQGATLPANGAEDEW